MSITLLRHTTPLDHKGLCYGRLNLDLADSFEAEAVNALSSLGEIEIILSSPLTRCARLARYIADQRGLNVIVEPRLREMDFGRWEGRAWSDIPREELDTWTADFLHARPHGGESVAMLKIRTKAVLAACQRREPAHMLCVTHSGVIKAAFATGDRAQDFSRDVPFGGAEIWRQG